MGNLGTASLDAKQINDLLQVVAVGTEIEKVGAASQEQVSRQQTGRVLSLATKSVRTPSSKSQSKHKKVVQPVGSRSRRHFELCARLLACAQRLYLSDAEWNAMEDPTEEYLSDITHCLGPEDSFMDPPTRTALSCPLTDLVSNPWMLNVAGPLWSCCDNLANGQTRVELLGTQDTAGSAASNAKATHSDSFPFSPILRLISEKNLVAPKSAVPYLQLVCACAETYPLGECWTSSTHYWHKYTPKDQFTEDSTCSNGCAPDDIALVVFMVTNILEAFGGPNGDQQTQVWALTCLIRLTESSALLKFASEGKGERLTVLSFVWQRVWHTVFNSNLRYASYTRCAQSDSIGELVLVLLSEMVRQKCTEPMMERAGGISLTQSPANAFLPTNQGQVWSLDAFLNVDDIHVQAVFDLMSAMLHSAGLSEEGRDAIDGSGLQYAMGVSSAAPPAKLVARATRRYRLVALCLYYIENHLSSPLPPQRAVTGAACACLLSLISGRPTPSPSTFDNDGSVISQGRLRRFCVTDTPFGGQHRCPNVSLEPTFFSVFQCLWNNGEVDQIPKSWLPDCAIRAAEFHECGLTISRELLGLQRQLMENYHCDFVSPSMASDMKAFVICIVERVSGIEPDGDYEYDESSTRDKPAGGSILDQMIRSIAALKLLMSVSAVFGASDAVIDQEDMDFLSGFINSVLDKVIKHFPSVDQREENCSSIMTDLLQVLRALMAISLACDNVQIADSISSKLVSLFGICLQLINVYSKSRGLRFSLSPLPKREDDVSDIDSDIEQSIRPTKQSVFSSESSDSEGGTKAGDRKRRRSSNSWSRKSKRRKDTAEVITDNYPNYLCAVRLSSIMILLQPSYGVCNMVAELMALPRAGKESDGRENRTCDLDLRASLHCLALFCSDMVIHRKENLPSMTTADFAVSFDDDMDENGSIVSLCCNLIKEMRASVGPSSAYYLFGFEVCKDLVSRREKSGGSELHPAECEDIAEVLRADSTLERKMLKARPILRARQLAAATAIFRSARENMHEKFDKEYIKTFVKPNICDLNEQIRKQSTYAVGAALRILSEQDKIVKFVKESLPPLLPTDSEQGILLDYRRWYMSAGLDGEVNTDGELNTDAQVWEGALHSIQASAIASTGVAAGSTSATDTLRMCLFEMIELSSERPDLEALSFRACEKVAELAGFGTVHKMLLSESEFLVQMWLNTGKKLVELPLLFTAPTVLLRALKAGTARHLLGSGAIALSNGPSPFDDDIRQSAMTQIREDAAQDFVERSVHFLVPITCMKMVMPSDEERFRAKDYLKEISHIVAPESDNASTSLSKVIRAHLHDVLAFSEPFHHDTDQKRREYGEAVVKLLKEMITSQVYDRQRRKNARLAVHRLLQRLGDDEYRFGEHHLSRKYVAEAIKSLMPEELGTTSEEPFVLIGSSITEYLLYSRFWLLQSVLMRQKVKRWSAIDLVCSFSIERIRSATSLNTQLGYCIHTIIETLAEPSLECIYPQALQTLNDLLREVFNQLSSATPRGFQSVISTEMSALLYRLIGTLLVTHERCQITLIKECLLSWEKEREFLRISLGLWLAANSSKYGIRDVWGWDDGVMEEKEERIQEVLAKRGIDDCLYKTLIGSYDALEHLLTNWRTLEGKCVAPMSSLSSFAMKINAYGSLRRRNPKLCAQSLVRDFLESIDRTAIADTSIEDGMSDFLNAVRRLVVNYSTQYSLCPGGLQHREPMLTIESRLLLDELRRLQEVLEHSPGNPMEFSVRVSNQEQGYSLVCTLLSMCEMSYPEDIRSAACRCLGALGPCDIEGLGSIELELSENVRGQEKPWEGDGDHLQNIMSSCLESLSQYLLSPRTETAVTALQSLKAILASPEGAECWKLVRNNDCKRLLGPLVASASQNATPKLNDFVLPAAYANSLIARASSGVNSTTSDLNWCWLEGLWKLNENGELSYEEWVKGVTCAMITCCYSEDKKQTTTDRVRGSGTFFRFCIKLCALEHVFAARAFPGIVLDLLLNSFSGESSSEKSILRKLNADPLSSIANQRISDCFTLLINCSSNDSSNDRNGSKLPRQSPSIQAVSLAVGTLDMLRKITQDQFLRSKHKKNTSKCVQPSISSAMPYGIVLRLSNLQVANACIRANHFASAPFYVDMHADKCYGGAGGIMERLSKGEMTNGFRATNAANLDKQNHINMTTFDDKLLLSSILNESFSALGDYDAAGAIELENAAMGFMDQEFKWNANRSLRADVLERLKALDVQCRSQNGSASTNMQIVKCMEDIGLESVLQTYIQGIVNQDGGPFHALSPVEQSSLRDRWFHTCMTSMQWNDDFFNASFAPEPSTSHVGFGTAPSNLHSGSDTSDCGFHESLSKALTAFLRDDSVAFCLLLTQARICLMHGAFLNGGGEAPLRGMVSTVDKMQLLNDLEGLNSADSCYDLALKWQKQNDTALGGCVIDYPGMVSEKPLRFDEFVVSIREVMLRAFQAKSTPSAEHDFNECLVSHLWQISSIARRVGHNDFADTCVQRLHAALRAKHPTGLDNNSLLRLRLEETIIMESRGDFSGAIRGLKLLSSHLETEKTKRGGLPPASEALYADALLTCGQWMSHYKVEPGRGIMENYLGPASELASGIYDKDKKNRHTAQRSFAAYLALAQLVLGLYDNARKRVESPEWEKAGNIMSAKEAEFEKCKEMKAEAKKAMDSDQKKKRKKPTDPHSKHTQKYHDLCRLVYDKEKELKIMREERDSTEASVPDLLRLALESFGNALACASNRESSDISRHTYRVVSLWFSNCDRGGYAATVNEVMTKVIEQIPSFRFVPLVYQIFSRIGGQAGDRESDKFQGILKKLVFRMSMDHPYHCLVQLFALSNGKNVGTGVGGRSAETYLANIDDGKVEAADEIIACLERSESRFVAELVAAYRVLVTTYIQLANTSTKEKFQDKKRLTGICFSELHTGGEQLDKCLWSRGIKKFSYMPCVLTKPPSVRAGGDYGNGIEDPVGSELISGFDSKFSITETGLSRPKILFCMGSRGGRFKQVVKGGDDIRQDAVMQQVFCYVNELMKRRDESSSTGNTHGSNPASRGGIPRTLKEQLNVVTYSIVPLSPTSGVLEWVSDTIPFHDILVDRNQEVRLHSKYYPGEWGHFHCLELAKNATSLEKKRAAFNEICQNFSPAFRFFFAERFRHSLPEWYAAKMKYTRSCAVSSMVGHVLGIGDRHTHNILIRETTGEVVHIDFGIVFEQGKVISCGRICFLRFFI